MNSGCVARVDVQYSMFHVEELETKPDKHLRVTKYIYPSAATVLLNLTSHSGAGLSEHFSSFTKFSVVEILSKIECFINGKNHSPLFVDVIEMQKLVITFNINRKCTC